LLVREKKSSPPYSIPIIIGRVDTFALPKNKTTEPEVNLGDFDIATTPLPRKRFFQPPLVASASE